MALANRTITREALRLGFDSCGIARVRPLSERETGLREWIESGRCGTLDYMRRNVEKRLDPALLFEGARSVVVCSVSYHREKPPSEIARRIATYAHSADYHTSLRKPLGELLAFIQAQVPGSSGRMFIDTAPLLEKTWAVEAGLGWIGRNSLLIQPRLGSYTLLGTLVTDAELEPNTPYPNDGCGSCRACIEACPVGALSGDRTVDASRCLSALTIEKIDDNKPGQPTLHGQIFGCEICQNLCPKNRLAARSENPLTEPLEELISMDEEAWLALTEEEFRVRFKESPLQRCGLERLQRQIRHRTK